MARVGHDGQHVDSTAAGLAGQLTALDIVFATLAYAGPLSGIAGYTALIIGMGNGLGAPGAFLVVTAVLLLFTVGYTALCRFVPNPGAFYAYITAGLGPRMGLGSAYLILASYVSIGVGFYAFAGLASKQFVEGLGGPSMDWWMYSMGYWILVTVLAYFHVAISARILAVLLIAELAVISVFDILVVLKGGKEGLSWTPFSWRSFSSGHLGIALIFAESMFCGFEATAIYREECRNPVVTIPRATYSVVLFIGLFYAASSWALIMGLGPSEAVRVSQADPAGAFFSVARAFGGQPLYLAASALLLTSVFAAHLSIQNVTARYVYSLSVDGVFPKPLGIAHPQHRSPHRASLVVSAGYLAATAGLVAIGLTAGQIYSWFAGIAAFAIICAMATTTVAVWVYFLRAREPGPWERSFAPMLAFLGLAGMVVIAVDSLPALIDGSRTLANGMVVGLAAVFGIGYITAARLEKSDPVLYARIGRR